MVNQHPWSDSRLSTMTSLRIISQNWIWNDCDMGGESGHFKEGKMAGCSDRRGTGGGVGGDVTDASASQNTFGYNF